MKLSPIERRAVVHYLETVEAELKRAREFIERGEGAETDAVFAIRNSLSLVAYHAESAYRIADAAVA